MDLDYDLYWCAVKDVTAADMIPQVYGPHASLRAPGEWETLRGDMKDQFKKRVYACFTKGVWTFFVSPRDIFRVETLFPGCEVVKLDCVSRYGWSSVEHWANGAIDWSVYGSMEDDYVRSEGDLPAATVKFTNATEDCETAPIKVGNAVTGFRHDKHERPRGFQIVDVHPPRELVLPGNQTIEQPSLGQVEAAVKEYLETPNARLMLKVGEDRAATTMMANYADGKIHIESQTSSRRVPRPQQGKRPLDALDVRRCFIDFFDEGELSEVYHWFVPD